MSVLLHIACQRLCNSSKNDKLSRRTEQDGVANILQLEHEGPAMKIGQKNTPVV